MTWPMTLAWWLLWATTIGIWLAYRRECRLRDRAESATRCRCGEHLAVIPVCLEVDQWHHCAAACRPRHEEVQP